MAEPAKTPVVDPAAPSVPPVSDAEFDLDDDAGSIDFGNPVGDFMALAEKHDAEDRGVAPATEPATPTEPVAAVEPDDPRYMPDPDDQAEPVTEPATPEPAVSPYAEFIEAGDTNAILDAVYKAEGKEYEKSDPYGFLDEVFPGVVLDDPEKIQNHVGTIAREHAEQFRIVSQWEALLEASPKMKAALTNLAEEFAKDPEKTLDENAVISAAFGAELFNAPDDFADETEISEFKGRLQKAADYAEARSKTTTEVEKAYGDQVKFHRDGLTKAVKSLVDQGIDPQEAQKTLRIHQLSIFGDRHGNRPDPVKVLGVLHKGLYADKIIKKVQVDFDGKVEAEVNRRINIELTRIRNGERPLENIPTLSGGQDPIVEEVIDPVFAGVPGLDRSTELEFI